MRKSWRSWIRSGVMLKILKMVIKLKFFNFFMASKFRSWGRKHICIIHCIHIESSESCSSKPSLQRIPIEFHRNVNKTRLWMESPFIMYRYSFQIVVVCTFQNTEEFLWWWIPRTTPTPVIKRKFKNTSQPSRWSLYAYAVSDFPALLSVTHISSDGSLFWLVTTLSGRPHLGHVAHPWPGHAALPGAGDAPEHQDGPGVYQPLAHDALEQRGLAAPTRTCSNCTHISGLLRVSYLDMGTWVYQFKK